MIDHYNEDKLVSNDWCHLQQVFKITYNIRKLELSCYLTAQLLFKKVRRFGLPWWRSG